MKTNQSETISNTQSNLLQSVKTQVNFLIKVDNFV